MSLYPESAAGAGRNPPAVANALLARNHGVDDAGGDRCWPGRYRPVAGKTGPWVGEGKPNKRKNLWTVSMTGHFISIMYLAPPF